MSILLLSNADDEIMSDAIVAIVDESDEHDFFIDALPFNQYSFVFTVNSKNAVWKDKILSAFYYQRKTFFGRNI